jgi:hypothetical protein
MTSSSNLIAPRWESGGARTAHYICRYSTLTWVSREFIGETAGNPFEFVGPQCLDGFVVGFSAVVGAIQFHDSR